MKPKLSIVIPMYNEERYIERCLTSLLYQTQRIHEVILVDDGSTDRTVKYANKFKDDFELLTILKQKNKGPGTARNLGAKKAKGNILILIDADMSFDENYLKYLIKPIVNGTEFGTTHGVERVANLDNVWARSWSIDRLPNPPLRTAVFRAIKKSVFLKHGGYDISKGYFDDSLEHIGSGRVVKKAICYHNNPETVNEAFKHSMWVGSGICKTGTLGYYIRRFSSILFLVVVCSTFIFFLFNNIMILIAVIAGLKTGIITYKVLERAIKEKYFSHLIFLPLMWIIRLSGYGCGFLKEKLKSQ